MLVLVVHRKARSMSKPGSSERALGDDSCPKCGTEMEPIDSGEFPLQNLRLCPECYLVMWSDENGLQIRQGEPVNRTALPKPASNRPKGRKEPDGDGPMAVARKRGEC